MPYQILLFITHGKTENNNKFKIESPTWNDKFELPHGSYSVSDIQVYFEYILKNHGEKIDNSSVKIQVNKIENRITFRIQNRYSLERLTPETMELLKKNTEKKTRQESFNKIQESCTCLFQINRLVVYQKFLKQIIFFKKHLIQNFKKLKSLTDQNSQPLEVEDRIDLTLVIQ